MSLRHTIDLVCDRCGYANRFEEPAALSTWQSGWTRADVLDLCRVCSNTVAQQQKAVQE